MRVTVQVDDNESFDIYIELPVEYVIHNEKRYKLTQWVYNDDSGDYTCQGSIASEWFDTPMSYSDLASKMQDLTWVVNPPTNFGNYITTTSS